MLLEIAKASLKDAHEMLSVTAENGCPHVRINFSSLDIIQTCKRKAYYALECGLTTAEESPALTFGKGIHKALEVWYCAPRKERLPGTAICDDYQDMLTALDRPMPEELQHGPCVRCGAVAAFVGESRALSSLPEEDKRSFRSGIGLLNAYFDKYQDDPYRVYSDASGPVCERKFSVVVLDAPTLKITFFGTIDVLLQNEITGRISVCDHKTTSQLGAQFYNRIKPNHQYTGYVWGAREALGVSCDEFIVNGIQVAKTKRDFARQFTTRNDEDFAELKDALVFSAQEYLRCKQTEHWPQTAPGPCSIYSGCQFIPLCEQPQALREPLMESLFTRRTNDTEAKSVAE